MHVAAEQGAIQACKLILDISEVNIINERDNKKQTPLHLATLNGHARGIKILMDNGADPNIKDLTGASPIDYVTKRNLFFCNSIIEICLRNYDKKNRMQGASSQNSIASSFNGSEPNLTPAPPTTPKNNFFRSFQAGLGRPPRPINTNSMSTEFNKTAPASLNNIHACESEELRNTIAIPSPPTGVKTRPNLRNGWNSTERILSGSMRLSRASTRTSLASDDLEKYMNASLTNINNPTSSQVPILKPIAPPRISSSGSGNIKIYSGRPQESSASLDALTIQAPPPPIKPRKSSSINSLNTADNRLTIVNGKNSLTSLNSNNLNVEDMSDDEEYSITSVKGEGFASDLSDNEMKNQVNPRIKNKKIALEHNPKRPNTPMDIRLSEQTKSERDPVKNIKHHHMSDPSITMTRFNEWDPFKQKENLERQKSPLKSKHQSNFAQTFLNVTDPSPRQFSGRVQTGSANQKGQQTTQFVNGNTNQETNSSTNLDLVISGQKLGARKESPTNTPREVSAHPDKKRIYSRRLQPLEKNSETIGANEGQFLRQKTSKSHNERKKLEPIKGLNTSHLENLTQSITETDPTSQTIANYEDEPSLSENTISSDKQIIYNVRVKKKKVIHFILFYYIFLNFYFFKNAFGKGRLIGPIIGNDEALKM